MRSRKVDRDASVQERTGASQSRTGTHTSPTRRRARAPRREFGAEIKVRFADVDHARIVYYPRFFHYFHIAFEEMFEQVLGVPYPEVIDREHVGFPSVRTECDYRAPVRFGDVLRIRVTCARLGKRSVTLHYRAERERDGVLCAEARVTTACVDMRTFTSQDIPARYRELFSRFAE
jgi:4-hydroxybenzoyl-CoA thioesterase